MVVQNDKLLRKQSYMDRNYKTVFTTSGRRKKKDHLTNDSWFLKPLWSRLHGKLHHKREQISPFFVRGCHNTVASDLQYLRKGSCAALICPAMSLWYKLFFPHHISTIDIHLCFLFTSSHFCFCFFFHFMVPIIHFQVLTGI